ncbi:MAG: hypothetical protein M3362_19715 [Acidobacteriota bacterium]|nr:hypothetical protein [Acidobacteriota bacterium]
MRAILSLCALCFVMLAGIVASTATQKRVLVRNLKRPDVVNGCGCYFSFPRDQRGTMFASGAAERDTWMNIDGIDTKLNFVSETEPTKTGSRGGERVGSRHTEKYAAGDITVDVLFIATQVCGPRDLHCEDTGYSAIFKVRKGNRTQVVRATGGCGC